MYVIIRSFALTIICVLISNSYKFEYITRNQWININKLLMRPILDPNARKLLKTNIYKKYYKWANLKARQFKMSHSYKCKHIPLEEIEQYAHMGLLDAIERYHPNNIHTNFTNYAIQYVKHKLYYGLEELKPIRKI